MNSAGVVSLIDALKSLSQVEKVLVEANIHFNLRTCLGSSIRSFRLLVQDSCHDLELDTHSANQNMHVVSW